MQRGEKWRNWKKNRYLINYPGKKEKQVHGSGNCFFHPLLEHPKTSKENAEGKPIPGNLESLFSFCLSFFLSGFVIFYVEFLFYFFRYRKIISPLAF